MGIPKLQNKQRLQLELPFLAEEIAQRNSSISRPTIVDDLSCWAAQKASMGLVRNDLTQDLILNSDGFPIVEAYNGAFPLELVEVGKLNKAQSGTWLNGFSDDVVLDRIWKRPAFYLNKIPPEGGFIAPDFSVKFHMSAIEKQYNIFRRNALAAIAQQQAHIPTIVPLTWAEHKSFDYCFSGLQPHGIYAISNVGTRQNFISRKFFIAGLKEAIRVLEPSGFVLYGYPMDNTFGIPTVLYTNPHIQIKRGIR